MAYERQYERLYDLIRHPPFNVSKGGRPVDAERLQGQIAFYAEKYQATPDSFDTALHPFPGRDLEKDIMGNLQRDIAGHRRLVAEAAEESCAWEQQTQVVEQLQSINASGQKINAEQQKITESQQKITAEQQKIIESQQKIIAAHLAIATPP